MSRKTKAKQRVMLCAGAILLAAPIGGVIGLLMQPSVDEATERKLQTSPASQLHMRLKMLAKTNDSPETVESGDLCYYAALHHATGHQLELSLLFLDALGERFPDSPFVRKAETLRPLIKTARKKGESPEAAAAAQVRLTLMALPLAVGTQPQTSSRPWWKSLPAGSVVMASPESEYAGWPIRYTGKTGDESPWNRDRMNKKLDGDWFAIRGFETSPIRTLTASRTAVAPILREYLDDPRLTGLPSNMFLSSHDDPNRPWYFSFWDHHEPRLLWRVCYELLCYAAGFQFDEIEDDPKIGKPYMQHVDDTLTPEVHAYIDRWLAECIEMTQRESILWHLRQIDPRSRAMTHHIPQLARGGTSNDLLELLHERFDPDDPESTLLLARLAMGLGDRDLFAVAVRHLVEGLSPNMDLTIALVVKHKMAEEKSRILAYLLALPVPSSYSDEMEWVRQLAMLGDTSKVPGMFERFQKGSLRKFPHYREMVELLAQQNRPDFNKIIVEECLAALSELRPPEATVEPGKTQDSRKAYRLWVIHREPVAQHSFTDKQKLRLCSAFLNWRAIVDKEAIAASRKANSVRLTTIDHRICDQAAHQLVESGLVSGGFDAYAPEPERDEQIAAIRKELHERYPAITKPSPTKPSPTEERPE